MQHLGLVLRVRHIFPLPPPPPARLHRHRSTTLCLEGAIAMVPCSVDFVQSMYSMLRALYILILASPDCKVCDGALPFEKVCLDRYLNLTLTPPLLPLDLLFTSATCDLRPCFPGQLDSPFSSLHASNYFRGCTPVSYYRTSNQKRCLYDLLSDVARGRGSKRSNYYQADQKRAPRF